MKENELAIGDWVCAAGTVLNGEERLMPPMRVVAIGETWVQLLIDPEAEHGPLEALFTVDEETGLTGAFELGEGMLTGKYLINLDSEDDGEIFIGCAGGIDTIATFRYTPEAAPKNYSFFRIDVSDLLGGHWATTSTRAASIRTRRWPVCCGRACRATSCV